MSALAWWSVAVGVLIILGRGPLIFAPAAAMRFYRTLIATPAPLRAIGVVIGAVGLLVAGAAWGGESGVERFMLGVGVLFALVAVLVLVAPAPYKRLAQAVLSFTDENVDTTIVRGIGVLGVAIGALFIYLGFAVL